MKIKQQKNNLKQSNICSEMCFSDIMIKYINLKVGVKNEKDNTYGY